jgi:sugar phosphate isomerase/epimerase
MALGMGAAGHRMETKLRAMAKAGFKGVEVRFLSLVPVERSQAGEGEYQETRRHYRLPSSDILLLRQVFYPCLQAESEFHAGDNAQDKLRSAAKATRALCDELKLEVICLQPLLNYEGIVNEEEHQERFEDAKFRFEVRCFPPYLLFLPSLSTGALSGEDEGEGSSN